MRRASRPVSSQVSPAHFFGVPRRFLSSFRGRMRWSDTKRVLFSISTQRRISVRILDDLITPCPVYSFAVSHRLSQLRLGRGEMQICYPFFRIFLQCVIAFDVEQLTCNVTSSMSFGSMMVSSVSTSPVSSTSDCSSLSVPACKWQCFANFSTENAWDCSLRSLFFVLLVDLMILYVSSVADLEVDLLDE